MTWFTSSLAMAALTSTALLATPVSAQRLDLAFLPPDYPPTDICRAPAEVLDANETQVSEGEAADDPEEAKLWVAFLKRDIRRLSRMDADRHFDFIDTLISKRLGLDPGFTEADAAFARIDLHIDAGRFDGLRRAGLVTALADAAEGLSQSERVRLAQYFMTGTGVAPDRARGEAMMAEEAYKGNANALLELLKLQLAGVELTEWFETPERTATLALGGKLGQVNRGLCGRAEFIAQAYSDGDFLEPRPELAFAWRKFAADQGGQRAAWRVVEHMLNAAVGTFDRDEIVHYLRLAVDDTFLIDSNDVDVLQNSGATRAEDIAEALARRHGHAPGRALQAAVEFFELPAPSPDQGLDDDGPELAYLREITQLDDVPGVIWTDLADEVLLRVGRWTGEVEARDALVKGIEAGDPNAHVKLARMMLRDAAETGNASDLEVLLLEAVDVHGHAPAQRALDQFYRCTAPTAPRSSVATRWSDTFAATHAQGISVQPRDYVTLSRATDGDYLARLHRRALAGSSAEMAGYLLRLESEAERNDDALRYWTAEVARSKKALELYATGAFELARNATEAEVAVDFVRRAQVSVGPSMALELATTLVRSDARDPAIAQEVRGILEGLGARGEGAAIRMLHRLMGYEDDRVYRQFADAIEVRGDFLALMFAAPYVDDVTFDDYMARAVSLMNCGTKDAAELADAFAKRGRVDAALHWVKVGLQIEGGNTMSRLRTNEYQVATFDVPLQIDADARDVSPLTVFMRDYALWGQTGTADFDRHRAAGVLSRALVSDDARVLDWAVEEYGRAERGTRTLVTRDASLDRVFERRAGEGVAAAQFAHAIRIRDTATTSDDLVTSAKWFKRAAENGHPSAMVEYGYAVAHGLGVARDPKLALIWLRRGQSLNAPRAEELTRLVLAMVDAGG